MQHGATEIQDARREWISERRGRVTEVRATSCSACASPCAGGMSLVGAMQHIGRYYGCKNNCWSIGKWRDIQLEDVSPQTCQGLGIPRYGEPYFFISVRIVAVAHMRHFEDWWRLAGFCRFVGRPERIGPMHDAHPTIFRSYHACFRFRRR